MNKPLYVQVPYNSSATWAFHRQNDLADYPANSPLNVFDDGNPATPNSCMASAKREVSYDAAAASEEGWINVLCDDATMSRFVRSSSLLLMALLLDVCRRHLVLHSVIHSVIYSHVMIARD